MKKKKKKKVKANSSSHTVPWPGEGNRLLTLKFSQAALMKRDWQSSPQGQTHGCHSVSYLAAGVSQILTSPAGSVESWRAVPTDRGAMAGLHTERKLPVQKLSYP